MNSQVAELASNIGNLLTGIGTILLALGAVFVIDQWKREKRYEARLEVARKMGALARKFDSEFYNARSSGRYQLEVQEQDKSELSITDQDDPEEYDRKQRLIPLRDTLTKLYEVNWEAEIVFGNSYNTIISNYNDAYRELRDAISVYFRPQFRWGVQSGKSDLVTLNEELQSVIYGTVDDELSARVHKATEDIISQLRKYV